ncbi:DNA topoisomerase 2-binding protein 1, partial [Dissophora globulifera]
MFRQSHPKRKTLIDPPPSSLSPAPQSQKEPLQNPNLPLLNALVCYTGASIRDREVIPKRVQALGGKVSPDLVTETALERRIPVVEPAWLTYIYDEWSKNHPVNLQKVTEDFATGPLKGCVICVTGLATDQRQEIQRDTIQYGGKYTSDLLKNITTHLICDYAFGEKYTSAIQWGIKCIPSQWFKDTLKTLELADETKYTIGAGGRERLQRKDLETRKQDDDKEDEQPLVVPDELYLEACQIYLCSSFPDAKAARYKKMIRNAGGIHVKEYDPQEVTHVLVPTDTLEPSTFALFAQGTDLPYIVNQQWLRRSYREGKVLPEAEFIVPFPTRTADGQQKPVRFDGATTWTTDAAVRSGMTGDKARTNNSRVAAVRTRRRSPTASDVVPGAAFKDYREGTTLVDSSSHKAPVSPPNNQSPQAHRVMHPRTASGVLSEALGDMTMDSALVLDPPTQEDSLTTATDVMHLDEDEEAQLSNIFLGLHISSYGCKEGVTKTIQEQTVACGGTYVDDVETLPAEVHLKTIVPLSMPWDEVKDLKGVILTSCWFERSLIEERVISSNDHFLYRPMKSIPIDGFQDLCISVSSSNLKEVEYTQIGRAIKILGATFFDRLHTTSTNLLISDHPSGPKYDFMSKNGRPIVKMEWLRRCIEEGTRLPFKGYFLNEESSTVPETQSNGSSRTQSMNGHQSDDSLRSNGSTDTLQATSTPQPIPSLTPLDGLAVCLPSRVKGDHREMQDLIIQMGARLHTSYDSAGTHFVHKGKATQDAKRDLRAAKRDGLYIVAPSWLYKCKETGLRVNEREHPETYDDKHLTLTTTTTHTPHDRPALSIVRKRSSSPSLRAPGRAGAGGRKKASAVGFGRTATGGQPPHLQGAIGQNSPTQTFQGTAAGVMSSMFGADPGSSSSAMSSSMSNNMDMSFASVTDASLLQQEGSDQLDNLGIWQPVPTIAPTTRGAAGRKRRRALPAVDGVSPSMTDMDTSAIYE